MSNIVMGRHISDSRRIRCEILKHIITYTRSLVIRYFGIIFKYGLRYSRRQAIAQRFAAAKIIGQTYINRQIDR